MQKHLQGTRGDWNELLGRALHGNEFGPVSDRGGVCGPPLPLSGSADKIVWALRRKQMRKDQLPRLDGLSDGAVLQRRGSHAAGLRGVRRGPLGLPRAPGGLPDGGGYRANDREKAKSQIESDFLFEEAAAPGFTAEDEWRKP